MSFLASIPDVFRQSNESGRGPLNSWSQLLMCDQQVSHVGHQSLLKRPRDSETILLNPVSINIPKKTQLCLKFSRGNCSFGDNCRYVHSYGHVQGIMPDRNRKQQQSWDDQDLKIINEMRLCKRFCSGEECRFGDRCNFLHQDLERVKEDLGFASGKRSCAITSLNASPVVYQKLEFWKTRLCQKWKTTGGNCPYGLKCNYAHGPGELRKLVSNTAPESGNVATSKACTPAKDESLFSETEILSTDKQQLCGKKFLFKWKEIEKISHVYADWIDDIPLHGL